jgi:hypothetical protein
MCTGGPCRYWLSQIAPRAWREEGAVDPATGAVFAVVWEVILTYETLPPLSRFSLQAAAPSPLLCTQVVANPTENGHFACAAQKDWRLMTAPDLYVGHFWVSGARPISNVETAEDGATYMLPRHQQRAKACCLACIQPHGDAHKVMSWALSCRARTT